MLTWGELLSAIGNVIVVVLILLFKGKGMEWVISLSGALRIFGTVYNLFTARIGVAETVAADVIGSLGVKGNEELETLADKLKEEDERRAPIDAGWVMTLIVILFIIHLARMGLDKSNFGILSPLVAVIGDIFVALVFAFGFIGPLRTIFRRFTGLFVRSFGNGCRKFRWRKEDGSVCVHWQRPG